MNLFIRFGTLKLVAGFGAICIMFAAGLSLSNLVNPRQAELSAMRRAAAQEDSPAIGASQTPAVSTAPSPAAPAAVPLEPEPADEPMTEAKLVFNETPLAEDSLTAYRIDRWRARSQRTTFLEAVAQDSSIAEAERTRARQSLWEEYSRQEKELACEEAMLSKGFGPVLVTIDESNRLTALVPTAMFSDTELVQISDILCRLGGCREEDIILIPLSN